MANWQLLGTILQNGFGVDPRKIEEALELRQGNGRRLGEVLVGMKTISQETLTRALAEQQGLPFRESLQAEPGSGEMLDLLPISFVKEYRVFPMERGDGRLRLAVADPLDSRPLNDLAALTGDFIEIIVSTPEEILRAINRSYEHHAGEAQEFIEEMEGGEAALAKDFEPEDLLDASDEAPIIRFVNSLITQGYKERASDIHVEPFESELVVRYRIDGILYEVVRPPQKAQASIISRLKIMANLNIAEKRLPQDGRFRVRIAGKDVDVRVSTLPTAFGERVVLRLLDKATNVLGLEEIGMGSNLLRQIDQHDPQEPRHLPRDGTDRFGQDDHPLCRPDPPQQSGAEHHHG